MEYLIPDTKFENYYSLKTTADKKQLDIEIVRFHFLVDKITSRKLLVEDLALHDKAKVLFKADIETSLERLGYENNKIHYLCEEEWKQQQEFLKEREKSIGKIKSPN